MFLDDFNLGVLGVSEVGVLLQWREAELGGELVKLQFVDVVLLVVFWHFLCLFEWSQGFEVKYFMLQAFPSSQRSALLG